MLIVFYLFYLVYPLVYSSFCLGLILWLHLTCGAFSLLVVVPLLGSSHLCIWTMFGMIYFDFIDFIYGMWFCPNPSPWWVFFILKKKSFLAIESWSNSWRERRLSKLKPTWYFCWRILRRFSSIASSIILKIQLLPKAKGFNVLAKSI